jgi:soluble lytic murein transglycosylase-like protein
VVGATLVVCALCAADPVLGDIVPGPTSTTVLPPNQTKIVLMDPPPSSSTSTSTSTTSTSTTVTRPALSRSTAPAVVLPAAESPTLRALVEAAKAEVQRLVGEITAVEAGIAAQEAALAADQVQVSTDQALLAAAEQRVSRARADLDLAASRVTQLELSAATAADAVAPVRTVVARPPSPGHTPQDAAAQARKELDAALRRQADAAGVLAAVEPDRDRLRASTGGTTKAIDTRVAGLHQAREALARLREQLAAAEKAAATPTVDPSGAVTLSPGPSATATATVPRPWLALYGQAAATCPGLPWTVLAAVGAVESAHGQSNLVGVRSGANYAGAMGPMQFLEPTWQAYGVDGDGDGTKDVYNPTDAVYGAARYLCASGGGNLTTLRQALWAYNHADWYVDQVIQLASRY